MSDERDTREDGNGADPDAGDAAQPDRLRGEQRPAASGPTRRTRPAAGWPSPTRRVGVQGGRGRADRQGARHEVGHRRSGRRASRRRAKTAKDKGRGNPFSGLNFLREVIAELRKVIWPNRKQMVTYTSVVLVFLVFMVALIGGVDLAFSRRSAGVRLVG